MAAKQEGLGLLGFFFAALVAIMIGKYLVPNTTWAGKWF